MSGSICLQGKSSNARIYSSHLLDIYKEYLGIVRKPFVMKYRKDWQNEREYDLSNSRKPVDSSTVIPNVSTLPSKRWIEPRLLEGSVDELHALYASFHEWLKDHKHQRCEVMIHNRKAVVYLFKKESSALLFKLAWG